VTVRTWHPVVVADLLPFRALRPRPDLTSAVIAPPYDVMGSDEVRRRRAANERSITHIDVALAEDGENPYLTLAERMRAWIEDGTLRRDDAPSLTIHRMTFTDGLGRPRTISGVVGGLEVASGPGAAVLPHERTTPKDSTDRYDLTLATQANLSPVWGLALGDELERALETPGRTVNAATMTDSAVGPVKHRWEVVDDPGRIESIRAALSKDDVLIADGHHRYGVAQRVLAEHGEKLPGATHTLAFVSPLTEEQLAVAAIHRVYWGVALERLREGLSAGYRLVDGERLESPTRAHTIPEQIQTRDCPCLLDAAGNLQWLILDEAPGTTARDLDGARLEHLLREIPHEVGYLHDPVDAASAAMTGDATAAVFIRPVPIAEITRTGRTGEVMPPKSTFFSPKLPTGAVLRPLDGA